MDEDAFQAERARGKAFTTQEIVRETHELAGTLSRP